MILQASGSSGELDAGIRLAMLVIGLLFLVLAYGLIIRIIKRRK